jgi:hypothetical protein
MKRPRLSHEQIVRIIENVMVVGVYRGGRGREIILG